MKKYIFEFLRRGFIACGVGPIILAILYLISNRAGVLDTLTVSQVCIGIFSITALAFVAGGMNSIYQIERLPLMPAIFIHGGVLYSIYLITYLVNRWLEWNLISIAVFSAIFVVGYIIIWGIIYSTIKRKTRSLNEMLRQKQNIAEEQ